MKTTLLLIVIALMALPATAATVIVTIGPGLQFVPPIQSVTAGDTVQWLWAQSGHTTTSNAIAGPDAWNSGVLSMAQTFSHTFNTPGSFPYYCAVHSSPAGNAMNGVINVAAPSPAVPAMKTPLLILLATILSAGALLVMRSTSS